MCAAGFRAIVMMHVGLLLGSTIKWGKGLLLIVLNLERLAGKDILSKAMSSALVCNKL